MTTACATPLGLCRPSSPETGKIEGTRSKPKRLVERGWVDEDTPGMFTVARRRKAVSPNSR
ncbi:hypothetical protein [Streptomyces sp. NPDC001292]|uniref:hypothetical protein n=1 Tax=Streptomyces sp. NPDC001292 TaxID=3364558 RepID=UPI0036A69FB7